MTLQAQKCLIVPGWRSRVAVAAAGVTPRPLLLWTVRWLLKRRGAG